METIIITTFRKKEEKKSRERTYNQQFAVEKKNGQ